MRGSGERLHGMQEVTGSIPVFSTKKSTVLHRKYGAFLFAKADFRGLHCFACTVFELFAGGSDTTPNECCDQREPTAPKEKL